MDDSFMFEATRSGKTVMRLGESAPRGGASYRDGVASRKVQLAKILATFKQLVERGV